MPTDKRTEVRNRAIIDAAMRYVEKEGPQARRKRQAADDAIADMIGAAEYLKMRFGEDRARATIAGLYEAL